MPRLRTLIGALFLACSAAEAVGQDMEPRRWTPLPVGTNIAGVGYLYTSGDVHVDPVLRITTPRWTSTRSWPPTTATSPWGT